LLALSGGVDSTFLAYFARHVLGDRILAATAVAPAFPADEQQEAQALAESMDLPLRVVEVEKTQMAAFANNPEDRCYRCKMALFKQFRNIAREEGLNSVVDGTNADDLHAHRPGKKALQALDIGSPLMRAGWTKEDIRKASRLAGLPTADKPNRACLATRFPYGATITPERLRQVDRAEQALRDLGFRQVRVRVHDAMARLEVDADELPRMLEPAMRNKVADAVKACDFTHVSVDLEGYRTGSMDE
jgi:uncharacterized protein